MVVGVPDGTGIASSGPEVITSAPDEHQAAETAGDVFVDAAPFGGGGAEPATSSALAAPNGKPWAAPIPFTTSEAVPDKLVFILAAGSDARPGEDLLKTRADSIHLLCINPATGQGTLLGFPRDSWVEIPGHGRGKINNALALGGPDLLSATVRRLTGLPVDYYVITGFRGLMSMVDELGGVDVLVDRRMNDRGSGARFQRGWHHMNGGQALAFSRNRTDVAQGDLSRSEHQGLLMLSALAKMRAEVADDGGVARWIGVMLKHVKLNMPVTKLPNLGALARRLDPARIKNVVAPGRLGFTARQSVVFLTTEAAKLFEDLRPDAVVGSASAEAPASSSSSSSTTRPPRSSSATTRNPSGTTRPPSSTTTEPSSEESTTSTTEDTDTSVTLLPDR
jgi:LCP family protein required for cell wall assembly